LYGRFFEQYRYVPYVSSSSKWSFHPLDLKLEYITYFGSWLPVEVPESGVHDDSFDGRTVASLILGQELLQLLCESPTMAAGSPSNRSHGPTKHSDPNLRIQNVQIQNVQLPGIKRPRYKTSRVQNVQASKRLGYRASRIQNIQLHIVYLKHKSISKDAQVGYLHLNGDMGDTSGIFSTLDPESI
jgi:hypothetical protein